MHATEVVMEEIQGDLMGMILEFLTESVGQASIPTHSHPHREVAALHERCADVLGVRLATQNASATSDARCRAVTRLRAISRRSVELDQHRIVDVSSECVFDGVRIDAVSVRRQLNPVPDARGSVLHKCLGSRSAAISEGIRDNQLCIRTDGRPRPNIASALLHLFKRDVFLLRINERPHFVTLDSPHPQIADVPMVVSGTGTSQVLQQSQHRVLSNSEHTARCIDGVAFHQCAYDLGLFIGREAIHDALILRNRSRISQGENALDFRDRSRIITPMAKKRKNPYAVALGRKGGKKGGPARAANMTPEERSASARNAVLARWAKTKNDNPTKPQR
jgi:hypothetical protein